MKRKFLALTLAVSMIAGFGASAMAAEHDHAEPYGTKDAAGVGPQTEMQKTDEEDIVNYRGSTQFYINVDKDGTDGPVDIPDLEDVPGAGGICHYEIGWQIRRETNVSVTVPLYVCMYGYGGNGKVVAPTGSAYHMENDSYYTDKRTVDYIYACYTVQNILSEAQWSVAEYEGKADTYEAYIEGLNNLGGELAELKAESKETSGEYGYINMKATDDAADNYKIYRLSDCDLHTDTKTDKCVTEYFYRDTKNEVESVEVNGETISKTTVQYADGGKANNAPLQINVPTIKVEAYTWAIQSTSATKDLKAGEIAMTVNGLDLNKVYTSTMTSVSAAGGFEEHTLDIKDLNWFIAAPTDSENPGTLDLPVYAAIAGGSVNEEGCVPVVRVTYTVAPALDRMETGNYVTAK